MIVLYVLANVAYLCVLPLEQIQTAADDRVATAALHSMFGPIAATLMAIAIVISFYILTIAAVLVLRRKRPQAERPYRAFGYPVVPIAYIAAALLIVIVLLLYLTSTTWPGLLIVLTGIPVYLVWRRKERGLTTAVPANE